MPPASKKATPAEGHFANIKGSTSRPVVLLLLSRVSRALSRVTVIVCNALTCIETG
jgi:hypothetical protein